MINHLLVIIQFFLQHNGCLEAILITFSHFNGESVGITADRNKEESKI